MDLMSMDFGKIKGVNLGDNEASQVWQHDGLASLVINSYHDLVLVQKGDGMVPSLSKCSNVKE